MFSAQTYVERRKRLRDQLGSGVVLLPGNGESPMNYPDNPYRFHQDSSFLYFFGLDFPGLAGVIDIDEGREIVFGNELTLDDVIWMGPQPPLTERCEAVGITDVVGLGSLEAFFRGVGERKRAVHHLPPYRADGVAWLQELLGATASEIRDCASVPLIRAVVEQRSTKTAEEVAEIEKALDTVHEMQTTAMRMARPGLVEREIAGVMEGIAIARGGRLSFPTIFSVHGETLHNHHHENVMQEGDILISDSGAESLSHYAADITRTIPVSGRFDARQRDVYSIVHAAHQAAVAASKPGVEYRDVHALACRTIAAGLADLGLMKGDPEESVPAGAHTLFMPHGLGHMMGLDVHDMEGLGEDHVGYTDAIRRNPAFGFRSLRLGRALEPGFVITVEPGLYFIPELIDKWRSEGKNAQFIDYDALESFRDFGGARIEDDVLITEDGSRILGRPIPRTIEEVEAAASA